MTPALVVLGPYKGLDTNVVCVAPTGGNANQTICRTKRPGTGVTQVAMLSKVFTLRQLGSSFFLPRSEKMKENVVRFLFSSLIAIRLYLIYASVQKSNHVLKYDIKHMMRVCGKETDNVGDFMECIIRATYEINTKTDISVSLHFIRKGHAIDAIMIKATTKDRECMRECGISADAPCRTLPKISKANMRKAVTTKKAFIGAPGFLINVSDKHVKTNLDKEIY